jgi:hypothetical protein
MLSVVRNLWAARRTAQAIRYLHLEASASLPWPRRTRRKSLRVFALDLHVSLLKDLLPAFAYHGVDLTVWSIGSHNFIDRRFFKASDPVRHVNARTWRDLDDGASERFVRTYSSFLRSFDGFVAAFTPVFAKCFMPLGRPIMIHAGTRYEAPLTSRPREWERFNTDLVGYWDSGLLRLTTNNVADRDYLAHFTGLPADVLPSVSDVLPRGTGEGKHLISLVRDHALNAQVCAPYGPWQVATDLHRKGLSYRSLLGNARAVLINPYNVSLMVLFELASAGVPTFIPSDALIKTWFSEGMSTLSEVSWYQTEKLPISSLAADDPNNYASDHFADWWLGRADFNIDGLMPNVRRFESIQDVRDPDFISSQVDSEGILNPRERNLRLRGRQVEAVGEFVRMLRANR